MSDTVVVIPTNRPEQFRNWVNSWGLYILENNLKVIILWDGEDKNEFLKKTFRSELPDRYTVYDWKDIREDLKDASHIIPFRSDTIRSYGFLKAWEKGLNVWTMDDDVELIEGTDPLQEYLNAYDFLVPGVGYYDVGTRHTNTKEKMRGYPYKHRHVEIGVQYGGWTNVPDFDALKQIERYGEDGFTFDTITEVPRHLGVTGCIMNAYIPHKWIPAMYQLLMGMDEYGIDRYGDIWSGLFMKRIADHLREAVVINGSASVKHTRASDPWKNLIREAPGFETNEELWEHLLGSKIYGDTPLECYKSICSEAITRLYDWPGLDGYASKLADAQFAWVQLLNKRKPSE